MKILCIGEALIDMICTDTGTSLSEGQHFLKKAGGAPTNVAAAIAALGGEVELAAKVGADPFGKHLIDVMESFGVTTKWIFRDEHSFTTFAFVSLMEDGERDFYFNRGADGQLSWKEVDAINLDDVSIAHFGSATGFLPGPLQVAYQNLLQKAIQKNIFISFDPNYRHLLFKNNIETFVDQSWNFLNSCHFFKLSDEESMLITGKLTVKDAAETLLQKTSAVFAITLGKEGTMLGYKNETEIIPSIKVKPVDTTGAGDAFVGAVLYQLNNKSLQEIQSLTKEEWKHIIYNANKAGARTCEYMGAMEAFKHLSSDIFN
jgi:fructokinase